MTCPESGEAEQLLELSHLIFWPKFPLLFVFFYISNSTTVDALNIYLVAFHKFIFLSVVTFSSAASLPLTFQ